MNTKTDQTKKEPLEETKLPAEKTKTPVSKKKQAIAARIAHALNRDPNFTPAIVVKQIKSTIRRPKKQDLQLRSLGLGKIGRERRLPDTLSVRGRIAKVSHLVTYQIIEN